MYLNYTRIVVPGIGDRQQCGTGYRVTKDLVLTAFHVVDGMQPELATVKFENSAIPVRVVRLAWFDRDLDLALIQFESPPHVSPIPTIVHASPPVQTEWNSVGYPRRDKGDGTRKGLIGKIALANPEASRWDLEASTVRMENEESWSGCSGAPVFIGVGSGQILVAVIDARETESDGRVLRARPLPDRERTDFWDLIDDGSLKVLRLKIAEQLGKQEVVQAIAVAFSCSATPDDVVDVLVRGRLIDGLTGLIKAKRALNQEDWNAIREIALHLLPELSNPITIDDVRRQLAQGNMVIPVQVASLCVAEGVLAAAQRRRATLASHAKEPRGVHLMTVLESGKASGSVTPDGVEIGLQSLGDALEELVDKRLSLGVGLADRATRIEAALEGLIEDEDIFWYVVLRATDMGADQREKILDELGHVALRTKLLPILSLSGPGEKEQWRIADKLKRLWADSEDGLG